MHMGLAKLIILPYIFGLDTLRNTFNPFTNSIVVGFVSLLTTTILTDIQIGLFTFWKLRDWTFHSRLEVGWLVSADISLP